MPAKEGTDLSITISTRYDPVVHQVRLEKWLKENAPEFVYWVREYGEAATHPHFHIACIVRKPVRTDTVKKTIVNLMLKDQVLDDDERRRSVVVKIHHDIVGLAGSYCRKELGVELVDRRGWTEEQLNAADSRVAEYKKQKVDTMEPFEVRVLRETYEFIWAEKLSFDPGALERWESLSVEDRFTRCYKLAVFKHPRLCGMRPYLKSAILADWHSVIERTFNPELYLSNL